MVGDSDSDTDDDRGVREIVREELAKQEVTVARRSFLASLAAAAGLGAAGAYGLVQPAQASTHSGLIGSQNNLARVYAEQIRDGNDNVVMDVTGSGMSIQQALEVQADVSDDSANTLIDESVPAWAAQVGTSSSPVSSVHTDDTTINNSLIYGSHDIGAILEAESAGERVEHGTVTHGDPGNSNTDDFSHTTFDDTTVNFSTAFNTVPTVVQGSDSVDNRGRHTGFGTSKTGYTSRWIWYASSGSSGKNASFIAIGGD